MNITSTQNSLIKETAALREHKTRQETGLTLIDGQRELERALQTGVELVRVFYCPKLIKGQLNLKSLKSEGTECIEVTDHVFAKLAYGQRAEGVIGVARVPSKKLSELKLSANPLIVVVESVEKPGNLGAILRTCDGAGIDGVVICDGGTDVYNPNVIRASLGTVFSVPVAVATNAAALEYCRAQDIQICAAMPEAKTIYTKAKLNGALAVVVGSEESGLSDFWVGHADIKVKIPMHGRADSLNVSASTAILLYEIIRQRSV
jgi:TrmH family RNA methyltransferase